MSEVKKPQIKYIIVKNDGEGKEEFLKLFTGDWGILFNLGTAHGIHYVMRYPSGQQQPPIPAEDSALMLPSNPFKRPDKR